MFRLDAACFCHMGNVRANNEDNFFFIRTHLREQNQGLAGPIAQTVELRDGAVFMGVFDGMGGEDYGEVASYTAASCLQERVLATDKPGMAQEAFLQSCCSEMNRAVLDAAQRLGTNQMGTTAALALFCRDQIHVCNLGDSRIYRHREGELTQLSVDHTDQELMLANGITDRKPWLTRYLGTDPRQIEPEPFIQTFPLAVGDSYLICSDGVTDMVTDNQLLQLLRAPITASQCADLTVQAALRAGGRDNVTAIVVKVLG